jgi:hypothetical protein
LANRLGRPEANLTGLGFATTGLTSKRLELLLDLRPGATLVRLSRQFTLVGGFRTNVGSVTTAASSKGRELVVFDTATEQEIETAFTDTALHRVRMLVVSPDALLSTR